ncbi:MAG: DUF2147 domain-containing protein [Burkholderiaceae bacterium]
MGTFFTHRMPAILVAALIALSVSAAQASPAGLWKTIDDETGEARSLVRVTVDDGVLSGSVEKILDASKADAVCDACEGELKNQPIVGMTIIRDMRFVEDQFEGGTILDPNNGKTYKAIIWLDQDAQKLNVRGYIGLPLLGRSQIWQRAE